MPVSPPHTQERPRSPSLAAPWACTGLVALTALAVLGPAPSDLGALVADATTAVLALVGGLRSVQRAEQEPEARASWGLLGAVATVGVIGALLALRDILRADAAAQPVGFPSDGDLLNVPFLLMLALAHLLWPLGARPSRVRIRTALDGVIFGLACLVITWALVLGEMLRASNESTLAQSAAILSWVATTLLLGVLTYVYAGAPGVLRGPIGWFGVAAICAAASNLGVALLALDGRYYPGHPVDLLGVLGYLAGVAATFSPRPAVPPQSAAPARAQRLPPWLLDSLPYWPVLAALPIGAARSFRSGGADLTLLVLEGTLVLALLARQFIALRDLRVLSEGLEAEVDLRTHELARSLEALSRTQRLETVGKLAGGIAHDFNNILTVLGGCAETLRRRAGPYHAAPELALFDGAVAQGARLTRQLLTFSRDKVAAAKDIYPALLVRDMEPLLRRALGDAVELELRLDDSAGPVRIDPGQLEQVFLNLAVNARDAMPDGGRLEIALGMPRATSERTGGLLDARALVTLQVIDTGMGMSEEVAARAFEPFFTTKGPERGTGLGLATVYGIVTQAGGGVSLTTREGAGTTVEISLPMVEAVAPCPTTRAFTEPVLAGGGETVLLADDNAALRLLLARNLRDAGYRVLVACDGQEAVDLAERHPGPIPLLVTDAVMPRLAGPLAATAIRRLRPDMRIIMISGHGASEEALTHLPDVVLLPKPFAPSELLAEVRRVLDREA